jgi:thiamine biosynthesis lipoprotein
MRRRRFLAIAAGFAAMPASARASARWEGIALGAKARIELAGPEAVTRPALAAALAAIREAEARFSLYDPASTLSRLNSAGGLDPMPARFAALMARVDSLHAATAGLFDPTVQPVWAALARGAAPDWATIGWERVRRGGAAIRLGPDQALTLNGIAQGFATDMVVDTLRAHGLTDALVDIGEQAALGSRRLGLVDPGAGRVGALTLRDGAIATSSPRATPLGAHGHVLHPSGPRAPSWSSVTVEASDATLADGMSTALCHADATRVQWLRDLPGVRRIVLVDVEGNVRTV